jgi:hypothetical protein
VILFASHHAWGFARALRDFTRSRKSFLKIDINRPRYIVGNRNINRNSASKVHSRITDRLQPHPNSLTGSFIAEAQNADYKAAEHDHAQRFI